VLFFPIPDGMHTMKGRASLALARTHQELCPKRREYRSAHAFIPPTCFMKVLTGMSGPLVLATYRSARAHLLIALLSISSSHVQRMTAVNGFAFLANGRLANLKDAAEAS
jgi:hypothetical protein